ncbi:unnamed protein product [Allacma fusca]|uniref:Zinc transporter 2 n=1 Tax=Allacma fusca TaxID=39272 RepID=A0A8J2LMY0_9HEXA|nr:unnamed protein product [Allacma fusca]
MDERRKLLTEDTPRKMYSGQENHGNTIPESNFPNGTSLPITLCQCQQLRSSCPSPTCRRKAQTDDRDFNDANNIPKKNMSITLQNDSNEHCHDDELRNEFDKKARKKLWIASVLCVVFMIAEAVGGILAGSLAVATDAAHLLTDFAGFMISLFALYMAQRPATKRLSYGYHRAEVIGALTSVLLIWVVTGILVYMAVQRVIHQEFEIDAPIMLITSGVGLIVNIIMGCTLHQHSHGPGGGSHGHSHDGSGGHGHSHGQHNDVEASSSSSGSTPTSENSYKQEQININVRAAFIHVIGDFIQSVGVFAAALVIYFKKEWAIVDPICTFLFSILVLGTTYSIIGDALVVLMEGIPKGVDFNEVREALLSIKGVYKVHNLRIWSLSMDRIALSVHLAVHPTSGSSNSILKKASSLVRNKFGFSEMTIQIEEFSERFHSQLYTVRNNNVTTMSSSESERLRLRKYYFSHILPQRLARKKRGSDNYIVKIPPSKLQELIDHGKNINWTTTSSHQDQSQECPSERNDAVTRNQELMLPENQMQLFEEPPNAYEIEIEAADQAPSNGPISLLRRASELEKRGEQSTAQILKDVTKIMAIKNNGEWNLEETREMKSFAVRLVIHDKMSEPDFSAGTVAIGYGTGTGGALTSAVDAALVQLGKQPSACNSASGRSPKSNEIHGFGA